MIRIALIISLVVLAFSVKAQKKEAELFVTNHVNGAVGTSIKWVTKNVISENGFSLYRNEEGNSEWVKISKEPFTVNRGLDESFFNLKKDKDLYKSFKNRSYEQIKSNALLKVFVILQGIESNQFAEAAGILAHDVDVNNGSRVRYKLTELNATGELELGVSEYFTVGNAPELLPPDSVVINRNEKTTQFTWKPEELRYFGVEIFRSENGGKAERINPLLIRTQKNDEGIYPDYFYTDNDVVGESKYEYTLFAVNYFGQRSRASKPKNVSTVAGDDKLPTTITSLSTVGPKLQIEVYWKPIIDKDLLGYNVWARTGDDTLRKVNENLIPKSDTSYTFTENEIGSKYLQIETVYKQGGKKSYLAYTQLFDQLGPKQPTGLEISADSGKFILKWNAVQANDLAGYKIYKSLEEGQGNNWLVENSELIDTNYYELTFSKRSASKFSYYIIAQDSTFNQSEPSNIVSIKPKDMIAPEQPLLIDVSPKEREGTIEGLEVRWMSNSDLDLKGYNLYRRVKGDSAEMLQVNYNLLPTLMERYADRKAEEGVRYEYRLQAIDSSGLKSELSDAFYGELALNPKNLLPVSIDIKSNSKKKTIEISWDAYENTSLAGYILLLGSAKDDLQPKSGMFTKNNYKINMGPGTYYLQLRAIANNGMVAKSEILQTTIKSK